MKISLHTLSIVARLSSAAYAEQIRVVNLALPSEKLSLWIEGREVRSGIEANKASSYVSIGAGRKNVVLFSDRAAPRPFTLETQTGKRYTLVLTGGEYPRLVPFEENVGNPAPDGQVSLRIYNVSPSSGALSLTADSGSAQLKSFEPGQTGQTWIARNTTNLALSRAGSTVELSTTKTKLEKDTSVFVLERSLGGGGLLNPSLTILSD